MDRTLKDYPILFAKDKTGKTRQWKLQVLSENGKINIFIQHGLVDGQQVESLKEVKAGKNIGKKNETSIEQQAILVADKTFKDKIEKDGYSEKLDSEARINFDPMLAETFDPDSKSKRKVDIRFPCFVQPKLDGIRCLSYTRDKKWLNQSRQKKFFYHLDHINRELESIAANESIVFDGELYKHNTAFNHIVGVVKKQKINESDLMTLQTIGYYVYDCILPDQPDATFEERWKKLQTLFKTKNVKNIHLVDTRVCDSKENVGEYHTTFVQDNYEGLMLRNKTSVYQASRTRDLQKYKTFEDAEFEIVAFKEGEGNDTGTVVWKCITDEKKEFDVRPKGTLEERREMFQNGKEYIGKMLTVKFQGLSEYGIPRFPVGKAVRDYE